VRPEGKRKINLPSEVIPTNRPRIVPARRCGASSEKSCAPRARRDVEATDFFLLCELDSVAGLGCAPAIAWADEFVSPAGEEELSAIAGEVASGVFGAAVCGCTFVV
jgi:hypothetical protein